MLASQSPKCDHPHLGYGRTNISLIYISRVPLALLGAPELHIEEGDACVNGILKNVSTVYEEQENFSSITARESRSSMT